MSEDHVELDERGVDPDPMAQFESWYAEALRADLARADAVALATACPDGAPSVRMVLLKGADPAGFVLFTNYESRKGRELAANPRAGLAFYWAELGRQVRVTGRVEPLAGEESDEYFATRPRDSQLAAWASRQSEVIESRAALDEEFARMAGRFEGTDVPRPPFWGGFRLEPEVVEFWSGRPNRMHDRIRYTRERAEGATPRWRIERLSP